MNTNIILEAFHGTDIRCVDSIIKTGFICKPNKQNWLGNGIYFYLIIIWQVVDYESD